MTGYSIDGDKYYGQEGDYVSYDDFESMYAVGGSTDDVFSYEYWAMGEIEDDPYATIDPELYAIWDDIENSSTPEEELIWEVWDLYYEYWEEGDPEIWELKCDALPEELSWMT
jgi:hypothetical protein